MSMISQIFGISQTAPAGAEKNAPQTSADAKGQEYLSKLSGGDTVDGKIADIRGNDVTIELPGGGTVSAKLDNAMALSKGQSVTFEVRNTAGNQVALTPLYTNMNLSATAQKALQAAGMSVNADTLRMAVSMMDEGLGIDRSSLGDMYNRIMAHGDADIRSLVEMTRMGMEINDSSIEQYSAFKNYENQISDGMREIADSAVALYEELKADGNDAQAMRFLRELTEIIVKGDAALSGEEMASEEAARMPAPGAETATAETAGAVKTASGGSEGMTAIPAEPAGQEALLPELGKEISALLADPDAAVFSEHPEEADALTAAAGKETVRQDAETSTKGNQTAERSDTPSAEESLHSLLDTLPKEDSAASRMQSAFVSAVFRGGDPALAGKIAELEPTDRNLLKIANAVLKENDLSAAKNTLLADRLREILDGEDFKTVVKNAMKENWTLKPEQAGEKANVENLYQRLNAQTKELTQMLTQIAKPESAMAQNLGNMSNNLDFMNQMNQMYQYVQLPLRMNGSEATGDLFVYSDKKSLAANDGNVSALLHLDMKYLGPLDVYAAISQGNKVSTRFLVDSDEMIDFIAEHIHILNEHLEARGYSVSAKVSAHDEDLSDEPPGVRRLKETAGKSLLSRQSFDVRA